MQRGPDQIKKKIESKSTLRPAVQYTMAKKGDGKKDGKTTRSSRSKEKEKDDADENGKITYNPALLPDPPVQTPKNTEMNEQQRQEDQQEDSDNDLSVDVGATIGTTASGASVGVPNYLGELSEKRLSEKKKKAAELAERLRGSANKDKTNRAIEFTDLGSNSDEEPGINFLDLHSTRNLLLSTIR